MTDIAAKDVVLIYPKYHQQDFDRHNTPIPLQLLALAGPLLKAGFNVKIVDERVDEDLYGILSRLKSPPICFGVSAMFSHQPKSGLIISQWIRDNYPGIPIVWGGWFPSVMPKVAIADPRVDIVVKGKAETTFVELVDALYKKQKLDGLQGLVYKEADKIIETPDRPLEDPNQFPYKPYHLLNLEKYMFSEGYITLNSSYGCPFRCKFCSITSVLKKQWKGLKPERVLEEIDDIIKNYGIKIKHIAFQEDNFFHNKDRAKKILQLIVERGLNIEWGGNMRIDQFLRFDPELLKLIKISGCTVLAAGAESANQTMLDFICKDLKVEQIKKAAEVARDYDINLVLNFISGLPGETVKGFSETLGNIRECYKIYPKLQKNTRIFQYVPIPGTPLYQFECEQGLINEPGNFEEWADIASEVMRLNEFWSDYKLARYSKNIYRIMTFYFSVAYRMEGNHHNIIKRLLKKILKKTSIVRVENNIWSFPIEWYLAKLLHNVKSLFLRSNSNHS